MLRSFQTGNMKLLYIVLLGSVACVALARKPSKKPGKSSSKDLEDELDDLRQDFDAFKAQVAAVTGKAASTQDDGSVQVGNVHIHLHGNDSEVMSNTDGQNDQHIHLHMHVDGCPDHGHRDDHMQYHRQQWPRPQNRSMPGVNPTNKALLDKYVHENDPDEIHAHCEIMPNIDIPEGERENPSGYMHFSQKKSGGSVELNIHIHGFRVHDTPGGGAHLHGMHVHEGSDPENGCNGLGGHFNPDNTSHGGPMSAQRHTGDLGNIFVNHQGNVHFESKYTGISLLGPDSIIGHSVVIHETEDDVGTGTGGSTVHGNAGAREGCCKIVQVSGDIIDPHDHDHDNDDHDGHGHGHGHGHGQRHGK